MIQRRKFFGPKYDLLKESRKNINLNNKGTIALELIFRNLKSLTDQRIQIVHENIAGFMWAVDAERQLTDVRIRFMPKNLVLFAPRQQLPSVDVGIEQLEQLANSLISLCRKIEEFRFNFLSKEFAS